MPATLGGRGGAAAGCFRIANINNDRIHGDLGMDLAEDARQAAADDRGRRLRLDGLHLPVDQHARFSAISVPSISGGAAGVPGINNDDDFGFLDYAYRIYYGDEVGALVAQGVRRELLRHPRTTCSRTIRP